jgi:hypothetical protein
MTGGLPGAVIGFAAGVVINEVLVDGMGAYQDAQITKLEHKAVNKLYDEQKNYTETMARLNKPPETQEELTTLQTREVAEFKAQFQNETDTFNKEQAANATANPNDKIMFAQFQLSQVFDFQAALLNQTNFYTNKLNLTAPAEPDANAAQIQALVVSLGGQTQTAQSQPPKTQAELDALKQSEIAEFQAQQKKETADFNAEQAAKGAAADPNDNLLFAQYQQKQVADFNSLLLQQQKDFNSNLQTRGALDPKAPQSITTANVQSADLVTQMMTPNSNAQPYVVQSQASVQGVTSQNQSVAASKSKLFAHFQEQEAAEFIAKLEADQKAFKGNDADRALFVKAQNDQLDAFQAQLEAQKRKFYSLNTGKVSI